MKTVFCLSAIIGSLLFPVLARAELQWEATTLDLHPEIGAKQAVGHFKYKNVGAKPVHFKSVRTSCGCTAAQSQKDQVAPGEQGEITATFNVGDRIGSQVKTVTVQTDDASEPTTVLTLKANIVGLLEVQPNFVYWQGNEPAKAKTIVARVGGGAPVTKLDVSSSSPDFIVKVEPGSAAGEFHIDIQPKGTAKEASTTITIKPDFPKEAPRLYYAMARVTPVPPPPVNR